MSTSALILAGGLSTRMGRDKALLPFGTETLLERVARTVRGVVPDIIVAAGPLAVAPAGTRLIVDTEDGAGPLVALARALPTIEGARTLVVACDMPLLQPRLLARLLELGADVDALVPQHEGHLVPTCAVYRTAAAAEAAAALVSEGRRSLQSLADRLTTRLVSTEDLRAEDPELLSFTACNTVEEYVRALSLAGFR